MLAATGADQSPELRAIFNEVSEKKGLAETHRKPYLEKWNYYYGLYRSNQGLRKAWGDASDRDGVLQDAKRSWGAELFIPYTFSVIETIVPRVLSNRPRMLVLPRDEGSREKTEPVRQLIDSQQSKINYELKLQSVARSGFFYGIGVQKTFWDERVKSRRVHKRTMLGLLPGVNESGYKEVKADRTVFRGPQVEPVDPFDFFWDPTAESIETADWVLQRTWRTFKYVEQMVTSEKWLPIDLEAVKAGGTTTGRGEVWKDRWEAQGLTGRQAEHGKMFEVWEFHSGDRVCTVLADPGLVVQHGPNPFHHDEIPFQIFRPTVLPHEFVGIGEIEPIAHLQAELNTMRSQRRDNATLVLQKTFAYMEGAVDPSHLVMGPGVAIPTLIDPREAIRAIDVGDIPGSSFQEERALKEDMERATGVSDPITGAEASTASASTATGIQLIQAAANFRIRLKSRNLEAETIKPAAYQFLELDRQFVLKDEAVRVTDGEGAFDFPKVGPRELEGEFDLEPEGGSTEPENPAEKQNRAMALFNLLGQSQSVDQMRLTEYVLREFDVADPEAWLAPTTFPAAVLDVLLARLQQLGVDEQAARELIDGAIAEVKQPEEAGAPGAPEPETEPEPAAA